NQELQKGKSINEAVESTLTSTGKAITFTSIILIAGFSLFIFSSFQTTFSIGLLISLTLLFAIAIDLYLLPALLSSNQKAPKTVNHPDA
ncbi:MAG: MMPL family transporter, partial [Bacteroidota bacterium]